MAPSCLQYLAECGSSLLCAAVDHGEVEVGRVAVVGKVDEREAGATFEDEPPTVFRSGVVELRVPERLGFEVDGLGPLDDDPERTAADGRDADCVVQATVIGRTGSLSSPRSARALR